jgi:hypothetical protein
MRQVGSCISKAGCGRALFEAVMVDPPLSVLRSKHFSHREKTVISEEEND